MPAVARQRLWLLAAPLCMLGNPLIGNAADFASLGSRLDGDLKALSSGKSEGGGMSPSADVFPILSAREDVKKLLADEETFRTMVSIGLPTGNLQMVGACLQHHHLSRSCLSSSCLITELHPVLVIAAANHSFQLVQTP